ncbi:hypothetical protein ACFXK0_09955 [Nocardia sp. NPDC059177]|uniref:hypothetical protein n=1 Tax=Nocardia sp. NPDC059177 TaxID=3346759 RepID=UPI00369012D6
MDRPDAHRPIGARQHDPGSAHRTGRDRGAPRPRRLTESAEPSPAGPRHRVEGGPTTPAGIPVIPVAAIVTEDSFPTDRLPVVGGRFDPVARHALPDTAFAIEEPDNGPDTDELPIITPDTRAPETIGHRAPWEPPAPGPDTESARPAPDYNGDDEVFARMIDRSRRRSVPRWVAPLAASVAGAALIGGGYLQFRGPAPASTAASSPIETPAVTTAAGSCPAEQVGNQIQGNGPGGTDSGVSAILAFQHAYYVARSGDQARTLVAANAALPSGADIQAGIDTIPAGTTHCLAIVPGSEDGQYLVTITEYRPDEVPIRYNPQLVGTAVVGGKTLITSIGPVR